jgi:ubiquitin-protein ligase
MRHRLGAAFFPKTPRSIRLEADLRDMKAYKKDSTILDFEGKGDPPEQYTITYHGNSLVPDGKSGVKVGDIQQVRLSMGPMYPVERPNIDWQTPIVHPNISSHSVCLGNFSNAWTPHFRLVDLVEILWDYARMAILNPEGGYRQQFSTKQWEEMRRHFQFPVDRRPLRDKIFGNDEGSSRLRPQGAEDDIVFMEDDEGACER